MIAPIPAGTATLLARLVAAYPALGFEAASSVDVNVDDQPGVPAVVITFSHEGICIVDPLALGFDRISTRTAAERYSMSADDVVAMYDHNFPLGGGCA